MGNRSCIIFLTMVAKNLGLTDFTVDPNIYDSFKVNRNDRWIVDLKTPEEIVLAMKKLLKSISKKIPIIIIFQSKHLVELAQLHQKCTMKVLFLQPTTAIKFYHTHRFH